jgi:cytochrome c-type biogenesis protein CcmH
VTSRRFPLWTALGVVLVVALVIGSGVLRSGPPTPTQRAYAIESVLRCPSCEDLSVAQSSASTAVTVRATVAQQIVAGRSDQQIEDYLVARYGSSIVLDPPARGWSLLVWLLPVLGGGVAVVALVVVLLRRRTVASPESGQPDAEPPATAAEADERRRFLTRSLADADAEYLAGDLSDQDYLALRHRDMVRLASLGASSTSTVAAGDERVGADLADVMVADDPGPSSVSTAADGETAAPMEPTPAATRPIKRSRRSWWFLGGAVAAFGAALILAVSLFASDRMPGQSATGSFAETPQQQIEENLAQAATDVNSGQPGPAAQLYQTVLDKHPDNEVALAQLGWLEYQSGQQGHNQSLLDEARGKLNRAVALDPGDYAVRLYLGTVYLEQDDNPTAAVGQYQKFLADKPPAALVDQAASEVRNAYQQAGVPVPPQVSSA